MKSLQHLLREHPFLLGLEDRQVEVIVGCAKNVRFEPGDYLLHEGEEANDWFLLRSGQVSLESHSPETGVVQLGTLSENDVLGWSWLVSPYLWHFDARAVTATRAISLDGVCLRQKCDMDHDLGYEIMKRFLQIVQQRLVWSRMQVMDLYKPTKPSTTSR